MNIVHKDDLNTSQSYILNIFVLKPDRSNPSIWISSSNAEEHVENIPLYPINRKVFPIQNKLQAESNIPIDTVSYKLS